MGVPVTNILANTSDGFESDGTGAPVAVHVSGPPSTVESESKGKRVTPATCCEARKSSDTLLRKPGAVGRLALVRKQLSEAWSPPMSGWEMPEKTVNLLRRSLRISRYSIGA